MADFNLILHGMMVVVEVDKTDIDLLIPVADGHKFRYGWPDVDETMAPCTVPCRAPQFELREGAGALTIAGYGNSYRMIEYLSPTETLRIRRSTIAGFNAARTSIRVPKPSAFLEFRRVELTGAQGMGTSTPAAFHTPLPTRLSEVTVFRYKGIREGTLIQFLGHTVPWCDSKANLCIYAQCEDPCVHDTSGMNALFRPVSGITFDLDLADLATPEGRVRFTPWGFGDCHLKTLGEFKTGLTNPGGCGKGFVADD